jgi:N-methylhydantoinase B
MPDTEGAGRFRGTLSAYSEFSPTEGAMTVAYVSDGNVNPAKGARGGLSGGPSSQFRRRADGALEPVPGCAEVVLVPGEAMVSISCGGGGYGPPHGRDPRLVARDVREGWVSRDRAEGIYGVALTPDGEVDPQRTAELRTLRARRGA